MGQSIKNNTTVERICLYCKNPFKAILSYIKRGDNPRFCSVKCRILGMTGIKRTLKQKENIAKGHLGIKMPPRTESHRRNIGKAHSGEKCYFWKGGVCGENEKIKKSIDYRLWREAVFARDNWTCCVCKIKGGDLHPHHIKSFSQYPELRFAIDNGQTLCHKCHKLTENYGVNIKKTK